MIGFTDENQEGQWGWSNGDPPTYVNWAPGEPNNGQGIFSYENVAIMYGAGDPRAGLWNDMIGTLEEQQYWGVVEVTPLPELTIRVSEVELSWFALSGIYYQPQYRLSLTTNLWLDLGSPVLGTGSVSYLRDQVPIGAPQRFYRVRATPEPCPDSSGATRPSRGRVAKCCQHSDTRRRRSWSCWLSTPFHKCDHVCCVDFRFWRGATREHPPRWGTKIDFAALDLIRQETTIRVYASAAKNAVSLTGSRQSPVRTPLHRSNPNGSPS